MHKVGLTKAEEIRKQMDEAAMEAKLQAESQQNLDKYVASSTALQQAVEQHPSNSGGFSENLLRSLP